MGHHFVRTVPGINSAEMKLIGAILVIMATCAQSFGPMGPMSMGPMSMGPMSMGPMSMGRPYMRRFTNAATGGARSLAHMYGPGRFGPRGMFGPRMYGSRGMMNYPNSNNNQYQSGGSSSSYSKYIPGSFSGQGQGSGKGGQSSSYSKYIPSSYKHYWSKYYPMTQTLMAMPMVGTSAVMPDFASSFMPGGGSMGPSMGPMGPSMGPMGPSMGPSMMPQRPGGQPMGFICNLCTIHKYSKFQCPPWCQQGGGAGGSPF